MHSVKNVGKHKIEMRKEILNIGKIITSLRLHKTGQKYFKTQLSKIYDSFQKI